MILEEKSSWRKNTSYVKITRTFSSSNKPYKKSEDFIFVNLLLYLLLENLNFFSGQFF